jgi:hypothetical protein
VTLPGQFSTQTAEASCPTGTFAFGGGGIVTGANASQAVTMWESQPVGSSPPTGWRVGFEQGVAASPNPTWSVTAYVVCST